MRIIYSDKQAYHAPRWEWNFGKTVPYPEKNARIPRILKALQKSEHAQDIELAKSYPKRHILQVHKKELVDYIQSCEDMDEDEKVYAHIFPYRDFETHPKVDLRRAGFYCFDVGTIIGKHTYQAAKSAVDSAIQGVKLLLNKDERVVFSLCRPPGHHADRAIYGGYCYFNNAAIAAFELAEKGRVAILDIDFHHGNGTQSIFYEIPHIFFASIHGDPREHYPYFCGFKRETGKALGKGTNLNVPLPTGCDNQEYEKQLDTVLMKIRKFRPVFLVVSMGFDTFIDDPAGDFELTSDFYQTIGRKLYRFGCPVHVCLEGGYNVKQIGKNVVNFSNGLKGLD